MMKYFKSPKLIGTLIAVFWFAIGTYAFSWPPMACTPESCPNGPLANLKAENIKNGVTIAGITGNYIDNFSVCGEDFSGNCKIPNGSNKGTIDPDLVPENIKSGVNIFWMTWSLSLQDFLSVSGFQHTSNESKFTTSYVAGDTSDCKITIGTNTVAENIACTADNASYDFDPVLNENWGGLNVLLHTNENSLLLLWEANCAVIPSTEDSDNLDNDCDGSFDEIDGYTDVRSGSGCWNCPNGYEWVDMKGNGTNYTACRAWGYSGRTNCRWDSGINVAWTQNGGERIRN